MVNKVKVYKYLTLAIAFIAISSVSIYTLFSELAGEEVWKTAPVQNIYESCLSANGDYFSDGYMIYIINMIAILAVEYALRNEECLFLIRHGNRERFYRKRIKSQLITIAIIVIIYVTEGMLALAVLIDYKYVISVNSLTFCVYLICLDFVYLMRSTCLYLLIKDLTDNKIIAMIMTLLIYIASYALCHIVLQDAWLPCMDLHAAIKGYAGEINMYQFMQIFVRQICLTAIVAICGSAVFQKKDVMLGGKN